MPPREKKNYIGKSKNKRLESEKSDEVNEVKNESNPPFLPTTQKKPKIIQQADSNFEATPLKQTENVKPLSFWSKKLKDLESFTVNQKETKLGMYEFIASEDSFLPKKRYIKSRKKNNNNNLKKHTDFPVIIKKTENLKLKDKHILKKLKKDPIKKATSDKKVIENKENNERELKKNKITYQMPSEFLTSTPASNKIKSLGISNFISLSPIKRTEFEKFPNPRNKNNLEFSSHNITPKELNRKLKEREEDIKCFKVLRNRKILIKN